MKIINCICVFVILFASILSQPLFCNEDQEIDSLLVQLSNAKEDTTKVNILIHLAQQTTWTDIKSSEKYSTQALQLSEQINYIKGLAYSKYHLSNVYLDWEFDFAESLFVESLEHASAINDSMLIAKIYNGLGILKDNLDYPEDALIYYNKSLNIYLRHNQDSLAAALYNNLGILHLLIYQDSLGINYYHKAARINKSRNNYLWLAMNYLNIGSAYLEMDKPNEAYNYLQKCLNLADEHNINRIYLWININLSKYYLIIEDYKKSKEYANKALQLAKDHSNRLQELEALIVLNEISNKVSDLENAYQYLEQINVVKDSINKHNRLKELVLLEMRYKFAEERIAKELENINLEAKHYRKELTYLIIILVSVSVIFAISFLYIILRTRMRRKTLEQKNTLLEKEKLSMDLEIKKKELTTGVIYSIQKNEILSELTEELVDIEKAAAKEETRDAINKISKKIQGSIDAKAWDEFELRFQQVHIKFYEILAREYPALTPNEKRICAFLRLDMSSKEISRITGQSIPALEMARIRIRKKLGISNKDINLITFLSQY
jgi:tetratricopeptide (TPR) repeat protein